MSGTTDERRPVRRALLSVSDKAGLRELAAQLHAAGVQLFSTGSTAPFFTPWRSGLFSGGAWARRFDAAR